MRLAGQRIFHRYVMQTSTLGFFQGELYLSMYLSLFHLEKNNFETGPYYVAQDGLRFTILRRLTFGPWQPSCLSLPNTGITDMNKHIYSTNFKLLRANLPL